jgi:FlaA1/EpsC-like NDP-sugar epimerase
MKLFNITLLAVLYDALIVAASWILAYLLIANFDFSFQYFEGILKTLVCAVPIQIGVFWFFGLYRGIWLYSGAIDLIKFFFAALISMFSVILAFSLLQTNAIIPVAVLVIDALLIFVLIGGSRFVYKFLKEYFTLRINGNAADPVLVLGSGVAAMTLSKELAHSTDWRLVGFLDDDLTKLGRTINGIKVLGPLDSLPHWAMKMNVRQVIVAMPSASGNVRNHLIDMCKNIGVEVFSMPSLDNLLRGSDCLSHLTNIDLDDLLGRTPVQLDSNGLSFFLGNKTVLVTGAGGSIGSELCRQIALFNPSALVMVEENEFALYKLEQELVGLFPDLICKFLLGDVRDFSRIDEVFFNYKPNVVFHAAAYKHVPLLESENSWQAIRNNVLGTWTVASVAQRNNVGKFVLISTDKAVNPTNVMGASKRLAEKVCQGLQQVLGTDFVIVRFGNVLGSAGSVIPKFREQIAKGGPITVTHPEITRYFMSIPEASQLVLQAGMMGKKAEIFVLDMGEPVKIVDLANNLVRLSGLSPDAVKISFTGLRPGEKLYEELLTDKELTLQTVHKKLRIARAQAVDGIWLNELMGWVNSSKNQDEHSIKLELAKRVPEYQPDYKLD